MTAERIIELIKTLEPVEIERLFVLIKEYEAEVRRRQASVRHIKTDEKFEKAVDQVFAENKELFQMLAKLERKELGVTDEKTQP